MPNETQTTTEPWEIYYQRRFEESKVATKQLFHELNERGVKQVVAEFNGCGDDGQIENIAIDGVDVGNDDKHNDQIETCVYAALERDHAGWENNDGASGMVTLDVPACAIHVKIDVNYTDSEEYRHEYKL